LGLLAAVLLVGVYSLHVSLNHELYVETAVRKAVGAAENAQRLQSDDAAATEPARSG